MEHICRVPDRTLFLQCISEQELKQVWIAGYSATLFNSRCSCNGLHHGQQGMKPFHAVGLILLLACEMEL